MTNEPATVIHLQINGDHHAVAVGQDLLSLVSSLGLPASGVLVEHNGLALLRDEWARAPLADGDQLEILRVVAGG